MRFEISKSFQFGVFVQNYLSFLLSYPIFILFSVLYNKDSTIKVTIYNMYHLKIMREFV